MKIKKGKNNEKIIFNDNRNAINSDVLKGFTSKYL